MHVYAILNAINISPRSFASNFQELMSRENNLAYFHVDELAFLFAFSYKLLLFSTSSTSLLPDVGLQLPKLRHIPSSLEVSGK